MLWVVGSVLGVLVETAVIIALARPATSQYERELGSAPAAEPELVRLRRPPSPRQSTESARSPAARP